MRITSLILLLLVLFACSKDEVGPKDPINIDSEVQQTEIIAKLSGKTPIYDGYKLASRYEELDKARVRIYIEELLQILSLEGKEHIYGPIHSQTGINIYTTLSSTSSSNEYIIIGAHYDSVKDSPGANDNASGIALIYELLKKIQKLETRNKNVMFVFFDDEEVGLVGSKEFAKKIKKEKLNIHSVHTVDQMGWDNDEDRAIEIELSTNYLKQMYQTAGAKKNIPIHLSIVSSADHQSFRNESFNAVGLTEEYVNDDSTPYYHTSEDTYETINFDYLLSSTELMYIVIKDILSE